MVDFTKITTRLITEVADIERAVKGKIYKKGCTIIGLSAVTTTGAQLGYLDADGEVESKWAVVIPKEEINGKYLNITIERSFPAFFAKAHQTINLPFEMLRTFAVEMHDEQTQLAVVKYIEAVDEAVEEQIQMLEQLKNSKKYFLSKLMV